MGITSPDVQILMSAPQSLEFPQHFKFPQNVNHRCECLQPQDLDFTLTEDYFPEGFLQKDIRVDDRHHIIFATNIMISILWQAKNLFIDATFKVVHNPFTQLLSIHKIHW